MNPVILGAFGPPALACIRSWGKQGWTPGFICIRSEKESEPASRYLSDWITLPRSKVLTDEGIDIISGFLKKFNADGLTTIEEKNAVWLNQNRDKFPEKTAIWLPDNQTIQDVLSKKRQADIAKAVGFEVLPTYLFDLKSDTSVNSEHFPLCLRPSEPGTSSFKVRIVSSAQELADFIKSLKESRSPIIGQPFMNLPNLVIHGARTLTGAALGIQGFLVDRKFEGVTLTISPIELPSDLYQKCVDFTDAFNIVGNYHFELLFDLKTKAAYFLEINTRFGGTTAKVLPCGYDEPLTDLECYGIKADIRQMVKPVTVSNKQALLKYLFYIVIRRLSPLDYPDEPAMIKICKTLWAFITCRDDVLNLSDMQGAIGLYWGNIKAKLMP